MNINLFNKRLNINTLIGVGIGAGYLTNLRFFGPVGISELCMFLSTIILLFKNAKNGFKSVSFFEYIFKYYSLFSVLIILPFITLLNYLKGDHTNCIFPVYIISFSLEIVFTFLIVDSLRQKKVNPMEITTWFYLTFLFTNIFSLIYSPPVTQTTIELIEIAERYTGGAQNPNQLLFYASTLQLMLIVYMKKWLYLLLPPLVFIMWQTKSDAYNLSIFIIIIMYVYFRIITFKNTKYIYNIFILLITTSILIYFLLDKYSNLLVEIWEVSDEGDARINLARNGLIAAFDSPLWGLGSGSFSGIDKPYQGSEAHNTFIDLATQFGFIFPILIYTIFSLAFLKSIKQKNFFLAAFILGFIESGLFHFSARHFSFWLEIGIFITYIWSPKYTNEIKTSIN